MVATLEEAKMLVKRWINEYREVILYKSFTYDNKTWDCDETGRANITSANVMALLNGGNLPAGTMWRDYNNNDHEVTAMYMAGMANTLAGFTNQCYSAAWQHKAAVDSFTTIEECLNYNFSQEHWPQ